MRIGKAISHMERGGQCRRRAWGSDGGRVYVSDADQSLRWADSDPTEDVRCSLTAEDIAADDWEEVDR